MWSAEKHKVTNPEGLGKNMSRLSALFLLILIFISLLSSFEKME
jgi:hypothetical protein